MLADHVYCGSCGKEMHTNVGAEVCPFCGVYGMLQYVNKDEPEVELNYELQNRKYVWTVHHNYMTECALGDTEEEAVEEKFRLAGEDEEIGHYDVEEVYYEEV